MKILSFDVGIVNLAYCIFDSDLLKILEWKIISLENIKDHCKLHVNLITELDNRKQLTNHIDVVLIEKQPSFNPKMRIIAGCLQSYFFIRGMIDAEYKMKVIKFFSPKHKLKCYSGPELVIIGKNKSKYSQTKKMGVLICQAKLNEYSESTEIRELFEKSKKKDDLADCYLQALTYCIFEKLINENPGNVKITIKEILTKVIIKEKIKELVLTKENILETLNGVPQILKDSIDNKFKIKFPIDLISTELLFSNLSMKSYLKKIILP